MSEPSRFVVGERSTQRIGLIRLIAFGTPRGTALTRLAMSAEVSVTSLLLRLRE